MEEEEEMEDEQEEGEDEEKCEEERRSRRSSGRGGVGGVIINRKREERGRRRRTTRGRMMKTKRNDVGFFVSATTIERTLYRHPRPRAASRAACRVAEIFLAKKAVEGTRKIARRASLDDLPKFVGEVEGDEGIQGPDAREDDVH